MSGHGAHNTKANRERRKRRKKVREKEQQRVQEHVRQLNTLFNDCDKDNTGMLTEQELVIFLQGVMSIMGEDDLKEHEITNALHFVLAAADKDNDGGLS